jgi:hypothetical protein
MPVPENALQNITDSTVATLSLHPADPAFARECLERETGIEPATNSLEGCDSTTELLPPENSYQGSGFRNQVSVLPEAKYSAVECLADPYSLLPAFQSGADDGA